MPVIAVLNHEKFGASSSAGNERSSALRLTSPAKNADSCTRLYGRLGSLPNKVILAFGFARSSA